MDKKASECGGLNENGLYRLISLKYWYLEGGTVREEIRGVALLEEV